MPMMVRSLAKSVLVLQPGYSLRALNNKFKLVLAMARQWPELSAFMQRTSSVLGKQRMARLGVDCIGVVQWPYISKSWKAPLRLNVLASHYEVVSRYLPTLLLLGRDESLQLCDLSAYSPGCSLVLDRPIWFKREGELVLNLFQGDLRVASLAFTLCHMDGQLNLVIGAVQGIHKGIDSERSLAIYRDLTKDFEGMRPRSFLIEALKSLARTIGVTRIYAVADAYRHHRHAYFGADKGEDLAANYDVIWLEHGAVASAYQDFYSLPVAAARRSVDDIAAKKRAMYRRRHALLDQVFASIEAAIPGGVGQRQLHSHRQRLGSALRLPEDEPAIGSRTFSTKVAKLIRLLTTEPRADQRLRAYLRKAGVYPTLRKIVRELLKQGPRLLWKSPAATRTKVPLAAPAVAASELFPRDVLLLSEFSADQQPKSRPAQLQRMFQDLGHHCVSFDWRDAGACQIALQTCSVVIFHQLPAVAELAPLFAEAKRLQVNCWWDSDELIFDPVAYGQRDDVVGHSEDTINRLLAAVNQHRQALLACDQALAASPPLATAMREAGASQVCLVETAEQLGQVLAAPPSKSVRRLLSANIFFAPRSFGGATVIAEQMSRLTGATGRWQQFVFTAIPDTDVPRYSLYRYEAQGAAVLGMGLSEQISDRDMFENHSTVPIFEAVLKSVAPDLVHLHSIQGLGAQLADCCARAGIPFVVTLHDAWWICGRQFMINDQGRYCGQTSIDLAVCATCVDDAALNQHRQKLLADTLKQANLLLAPSRFCKDLYAANGFDPEHIQVNRNGIMAPAAGYQKQPGQTIRFGFVGGDSTVKGIDVIIRAFSGLDRSDYELKVVDNLLNMGFRSFNRHSIKIPGTVSIIPGYTQATMDAFFSGIDVLLFPTQCKETFGLAVREALVRDVWVISTHSGGTVEDIIEGVNGTIIPLSGDETYLRQAIVAILDDQPRFARHRNPFKDNIIVFSDQASELLGFYDEVLSEADAAAREPSALGSCQ
ncbi:hypothetical protein PS623_00145 [Pseudomonas fluorescens]|nr:hypothetical protein PS623_00145 [Pseudomonas fluorescens]